jgi:hypothetical protein
MDSAIISDNWYEKHSKLIEEINSIVIVNLRDKK